MEAIREAIETASGQLKEHPEAAVGTDAAATAVREDGLRFRVDGPNGAVVTDMSKSVGVGAMERSPTRRFLTRRRTPHGPVVSGRGRAGSAPRRRVSRVR